MLEIKKITHGDLPALAMLYKELMGEEFDPAELSAVAFNRIEANPDYMLIGAFVDAVLVGSLMGVACMDLIFDCRPFVVIENVIVGEAFRGHGVGGQLIAHIEDWAKGLNSSYVILVSGAKRTGAHAFYETCGYTDDVRGFRKHFVRS